MITLNELKARLKISNNNSDTILNEIILIATNRIEAYLNRKIISQDCIEYISGDGTNEAYLKNLKINEVEYIKELNFETYEYDSLYTDSEIFYTGEDMSSLIMLKFGNTFNTGRNNYQIKYNCGYEIEDIPKTLKEFCYEVCQFIFNYTKENGSKDILLTSSESLTDKGGVNTVYKELNFSQIDLFKKF